MSSPSPPAAPREPTGGIYYGGNDFTADVKFVYCSRVLEITPMTHHIKFKSADGLSVMDRIYSDFRNNFSDRGVRSVSQIIEDIFEDNVILERAKKHGRVAVYRKSMPYGTPTLERYRLWIPTAEEAFILEAHASSIGPGPYLANPPAGQSPYYAVRPEPLKRAGEDARGWWTVTGFGPNRQG